VSACHNSTAPPTSPGPRHAVASGGKAAPGISSLSAAAVTGAKPRPAAARATGLRAGSAQIALKASTTAAEGDGRPISSAVKEGSAAAARSPGAGSLAQPGTRTANSRPARTRLREELMRAVIPRARAPLDAAAAAR
jgi:hypothetical protein